MGIRTPWTLENEEVWKKTHQFGGKLWFVGGLLIVLLSLLVKESYVAFLFLGITAIICIVPIVYSYLEFKKVKK